MLITLECAPPRVSYLIPPVQTTLDLNEPLHVDLVIEHVCMDKPQISWSSCNAVIQNIYNISITKYMSFFFKNYGD